MKKLLFLSILTALSLSLPVQAQYTYRISAATLKNSGIDVEALQKENNVSRDNAGFIIQFSSEKDRANFSKAVSEKNPVKANAWLKGSAGPLQSKQNTMTATEAVNYFTGGAAKDILSPPQQNKNNTQIPLRPTYRLTVNGKELAAGGLDINKFKNVTDNGDGTYTINAADENDYKALKSTLDIRNIKLLDNPEGTAETKKENVPGVTVAEGSSSKDETKKIGQGGNAEKADNTQKQSGIKGVCANEKTVFKQISCKALRFLIDLRIIAYIISGFGMIAFTYAAIFNKISWKHFSQIGIGLFILSMMGQFIEYFSGDKTALAKLGYGNFIGSEYKAISGTSDKIECGHGVDATNCLPNVDIVAPKRKEKWTIKDLKGSIKSGIDTARGAYNTYQTAKNTYNNVKENAKSIKNAIKNSDGGLEGILSTATQIAGATNTMMFAAKSGLGGMAAGVTNIANAAQDMRSTEKQRQKNQNVRLNGKDPKATNKVAEWLSSAGEGGKMITAASNATNTVGKAVGSVGIAANAGYEGNKMGGSKFGSILGGAMALGTAAAEGSGIYNEQAAVIQARKDEKLRQEKKAAIAGGSKNLDAFADNMNKNIKADLADVLKQNDREIDKKAETLMAQAEQKKQDIAKKNDNAKKKAATASALVNTATTQVSQPQEESPSPEAGTVRTAQPVKQASQVIAENNKKTPSPTSSRSSGISTGSTVPKLTNKDGSISTLNKDGSITVTGKNGKTTTYAAGSNYVKTIVAYIRDNPEVAEDIFMKPKKDGGGGEVINGLNDWMNSNHAQ